MNFTYESYLGLLDLARENGYRVAGYHDPEGCDRCVILRHDVDMDMGRALQMAELEHQHGIRSTYFVLLTSDLYNLQSGRNRSMARAIQDMGHEIGLHFDERAYPEDMGDPDRVRQRIREEMDILSGILGTEATVFSYHRPSSAVLDADITVPGGVNAYGSGFFRESKYLSDSRRRWREPVEEVIRQGGHPRLHILTHPFWYYSAEKGMGEALSSFVERACAERYDALDDNFTDLGSVIGRGGMGS